MISLTRNQQAGSNARPSNVGSYHQYEKAYNTVGPQEWITLPDTLAPCKVCVSFPQPGSAIIEGTCSPAEILQGTGTDTTGGWSPVFYPLAEMVTDTTQILVQGDTAIRLNILAGTIVIISVNC